MWVGAAESGIPVGAHNQVCIWQPVCQLCHLFTSTTAQTITHAPTTRLREVEGHCKVVINCPLPQLTLFPWHTPPGLAACECNGRIVYLYLFCCQGDACIPTRLNTYALHNLCTYLRLNSSLIYSSPFIGLKVYS